SRVRRLMKPAHFFLILIFLLTAARLCHVRILWAEEDLPMAAAAQMQAGKTPYRDISVAKPALLPAAYPPSPTRARWRLRPRRCPLCAPARWPTGSLAMCGAPRRRAGRRG